MNIIIKYLPVFIQNILISVFNTYQYKVRHGGVYKKYRKYYEYYDNKASKEEVDIEVKKRTHDFLDYVKKRSDWYSGIDVYNLSSIGILRKLDIVNNLDKIITIDKSKGILSKTGGTTGTSMSVYYHKEDMQERFAALDHFRAKYGYELGKKTAWFSGKEIVTRKDISQGLCFKEDYINKVRFFSTYDINKNNFSIYWKALNEYKPEFIVGYPSSVYDLCVLAKNAGLTADFDLKVFFPTAETVLPIHREIIFEVLGCQIKDQYASSEGAPLIFECEFGNMHIHPLTGFFEYKTPGLNNEVLVTSFTTRGTPLIKYAIGDSINLNDQDHKCSCGSSHPLVTEIEGRSQDYILTKEFGRISASHLTLAINKVKGILLFQMLQKKTERVEVYVVSNSLFDKKEKENLLIHLRRIIGDLIYIDIICVDEIPREKSGKFRIVKNLIE